MANRASLTPAGVAGQLLFPVQRVRAVQPVPRVQHRRAGAQARTSAPAPPPRLAPCSIWTLMPRCPTTYRLPSFILADPDSNLLHLGSSVPGKGQVDGLVISRLQLYIYITGVHESNTDRAARRLEDGGYGVGFRLLEALSATERGRRRDTRLLDALRFVHGTLWKYLFGRPARDLEQSNTVSTHRAFDLRHFTDDLDPVTRSCAPAGLRWSVDAWGLLHTARTAVMPCGAVWVC